MSKIEKIQESENKLVEIQNSSEAVILQLKEENINLRTIIIALKYKIGNYLEPPYVQIFD